MDKILSTIEQHFQLGEESEFKKKHPVEEREKQMRKFRGLYPNRLPCIVERVKGSDVPDLDRKKFLVPDDLTVGQFLYVIRKRIRLNLDQALFVFVNGEQPPLNMLLSQLYARQENQNDFLFWQYRAESTFGLLEKAQAKIP